MELKRDKLLQNGKYRIEGVLGQGGFGITYLAVQVGLNRKVAVKEFYMKEYCERNGDASTVSMGTSGSRELVDRYKNKFVKEAQNIASFNHNNIIRIHDIFEENGTAYYVMEYHDCGSLSDYVTRKGRLSEEEAMFFIRQIADALAYIHELKINHLDIKPGNILLDKKNNAILIDFGLSKHYDEVGGQTTSSPVGRSKGYAPMEQYKQGGVSQFSPSTDIYSLGATMYKLVTGETPAEADEIYEDGLSFPADVVLSDSVKKAIEFAMQPKRKDRPQSIDEFLRSFEVTACSKVQSDEATVIDVVDNDSVDEETVFETKEQEQERKAEEEIKRRVEAELKRREEEERERRKEEEIKRRVEEELKRREEEEKKRKDEQEQERKRKEAEEQYQLGEEYYKKGDYSEAVKWYRKSAEQGNAYGQYALALCYEKGQGVTQDYAEAVKWYRKSAEQGNAYGQYALALCYEKGQGVTQAIAEAMKWYKKAADNGDQDAKDKVEEMAKQLSAKQINGHEYVDLGLPSGLKWATCNVGANKPEDYGYYFAWGETETKTEYSEGNSLTRGHSISELRRRGIVDGNNRLTSSYDAARAKWGGSWRMPTEKELRELENKCTWTWTTQNGVEGYKVTGPNGNSIFLPAAGYCEGTSLYNGGYKGYYWSSTPNDDFDYGAYELYFFNGNKLYVCYNRRYRGLTVRPITE